MGPLTPASVARPQKSKSSRKRPLTKEEEAKRQSVERLHLITRPRPNFALSRQLTLAQSGGAPLPVTKPILQRPGGDFDEVNTSSKHANEPLTDTPHSHHAFAKIQPQLQTPQSKTGFPSPAAASSLSVPKKPVREYAERVNRQVQDRRDIFEFEDDSSDKIPPKHALSFKLDAQLPDEELAVRRPRTSSAQHPTERPAIEPAGREDETLEQCLRRSNDIDAANDIETQRRSNPPIGADGLEERGEPAAEAGAGSEEEAPDSRVESEQIDYIDRGFVGFEEDEEPLFVPPIPSSIRSKRRRTEAQDENLQSQQRQMNDVEEENESDEEHRAPRPKKRGRSGRKVPAKEAHSKVLQDLTSRRESKSARKPRKDAPEKVPIPKRPRRLPVDELVTVSQRLGSPVLNDSDSPPLELSQDPISPISEGESENELHKTHIVISKVGRQRRKGIGPIVISEFRVPEPLSPRSRRIYLLTPSYSDGFEGREAEPIGRIMPIRGPPFRKEAHQKVSLRVPQLTLVAERADSASPTIPPRCRKKKKRQRDVQLEPQACPSIEQDDQLQFIQDQAPDEALQKEPQLQEMTGEEECPAQVIDEGPQDEPQLQDITEEEECPAQVIGRLETEETSNMKAPDLLNPPLILRTTEPTGMFEKSRPNKSPDGGALVLYHESIFVPPMTPRLLSDAEHSSQRHASTTSPLKRKLRDTLARDIKRSRSIRSTLPFGKADNKEPPELPFSSSQPSFNPSYRKTPKQKKADIEAMHELSLVSVKRLQSPSDDENDSEEDGSDGSENRHTKEDSPWTASDYEEEEAEDQDEEELATHAGSDIVVEEGSYYEQIETGVISEEPVDEMEPNKDDSDLLQGDSQLESTLNDRIAKDPVALQDPAASALKALEHLPRIDKANPPVQHQDKHMQHGVQHIRPIPRAASSLSRYHEYSDDESYRPSAPISTGLSMEVEDEIQDSPEASPVPVHNRQRHTSLLVPSRRRSQFSSGSLNLVRSRRHDPNLAISAGDQNGSQGSIILGGTQQLPEIPETQLVSEAERPQSQVYEVPSYFSQAEHILNQPIGSKSLARTKSKIGRPHFDLVQGSTELMPPSTMLKTTISPIKSTPRLPTLIEEVKTPSQSLNTLTRKASSGMGTLPASARRRMMSAPWKSPFIPQAKARGV